MKNEKKVFCEKSVKMNAVKCFGCSCLYACLQKNPSAKEMDTENLDGLLKSNVEGTSLKALRWCNV